MRRDSYKYTFIGMIVFIIIGYAGCEACNTIESYTNKAISNVANNAADNYIEKQSKKYDEILGDSQYWNKYKTEYGTNDTDLLGQWENDDKYIVITTENVSVYTFKENTDDSDSEKMLSNIFYYTISDNRIILDKNIIYQYSIEDDSLTLQYDNASKQNNIFDTDNIILKQDRNNN